MHAACDVPGLVLASHVPGASGSGAPPKERTPDAPAGSYSTHCYYYSYRIVHDEGWVALHCMHDLVAASCHGACVFPLQELQWST